MLYGKNFLDLTDQSPPNYILPKISKKEHLILHHMNVLTGDNGTGKSRFLRYLASIKPFWFLSDDNRRGYIDSCKKRFLGEIKQFLNDYQIKSSKLDQLIEFNLEMINFLKKSERQNEIIFVGEFLDQIISDEIIKDFQSKYQDIEEKLIEGRVIDDEINDINFDDSYETKSLSDITPYDPESFLDDESDQKSEKVEISISGKNIIDEGKLFKNIDPTTDKYQNIFKEQLKDITKRFFENIIKLDPYNIKILYIPNIRGIKILGKKKGLDDFSESLKTQFFPNDQNSVEIFTGFNLYPEITKRLLGIQTERQKIAEYENFLSSTFFNNQEINIIPDLETETINLRIGGEIRPFYQFGDGIQQIILLTFPIFMNKNRDQVVFIENPEKNLHPIWQRTLFYLYRKYKTKKFFFTSHSPCFIDIFKNSEDETSIFHFEKIYRGDNISEKKSPSIFTVSHISVWEQHIAKSLGIPIELILRNRSSILISTEIERTILSHFLVIYFENIIEHNPKQNFFIENLHFTIFKYCSETISSCTDLNTPSKDQKTNTLFSKILLITHNAKVLENQQCISDSIYLPSKPIISQINFDILKNYIDKNFKISEINMLEIEENYSKGVNIFEILDKFEFINSNYNNISQNVHQQIKFIKKVLENIKSVDDMEVETLALTKKIYQFISKNI